MHNLVNLNTKAVIILLTTHQFLFRNIQNHRHLCPKRL